MPLLVVVGSLVRDKTSRDHTVHRTSGATGLDYCCDFQKANRAVIIRGQLAMASQLVIRACERRAENGAELAENRVERSRCIADKKLIRRSR